MSIDYPLGAPTARAAYPYYPFQDPSLATIPYPFVSMVDSPGFYLTVFGAQVDRARLDMGSIFARQDFESDVVCLDNWTVIGGLRWYHLFNYGVRTDSGDQTPVSPSPASSLFRSLLSGYGFKYE